MRQENMIESLTHFKFLFKIFQIYNIILGYLTYFRTLINY